MNADERSVLLPNAPITAPEEQLKVYVIDWELCQLSSVAFDLGQMFGELFELKHFKGIDAGLCKALRNSNKIH
jgi:thiamine kinase-like enzyme